MKLNELVEYLEGQRSLFGDSEVLLLKDGRLLPFDLGHLVFAGFSEWGGNGLLLEARTNLAADITAQLPEGMTAIWRPKNQTENGS